MTALQAVAISSLLASSGYWLSLKKLCRHTQIQLNTSFFFTCSVNPHLLPPDSSPPPPPPPHLSITARHSFLQVNLLPRRKRKPVGAEPNVGGACCQSIMSSRANGAARIARVAPEVANGRRRWSVWDLYIVVHSFLSWMLIYKHFSIQCSST